MVIQRDESRLLDGRDGLVEVAVIELLLAGLAAVHHHRVLVDDFVDDVMVLFAQPELIVHLDHIVRVLKVGVHHSCLERERGRRRVEGMGGETIRM